MDADPRQVAERWVHAISLHDLDAAVDCFAVEYRDEAPARRGEFVQGRDKVRENFIKLFRELPDLRAEMLGSAVDADTIWMEWRMSGTRADASRMEFAGVNLFGVREGRFAWGRIYTELVREAGGIDVQLERMTRNSDQFAPGSQAQQSPDNVIRDMFDAYAKADQRRLFEVLDPSVVYHLPGRTLMAGEYLGPHEVLALWDRQKLYMGGKPYRVKQLAMVAGGEQVVLLTEVTAERDGRTLTFLGANVYRVRDGRVAEGRVFIFDVASFDEFWRDMPPRS